MIRENLIFRSALVISTALHIGGIGFLQSGPCFFKNGLSNNENNIVVYEIGWIERQLADKKIEKIILSKDEVFEMRQSRDEKHTSIPLQEGNSGSKDENAGRSTDTYLLLVRKRIESAKFYPLEAKRRLINGCVTVSFNIDKDGLSKNVEIVKSSGFTILDNTSKEMVLKANPFPKPPNGDINHYIQTTIVFEL